MFVTLMFGILDIFFREFVARNRFKVPPEGTPVIFVCAPHANQFLDPFVVMCGVGRADVAFLTAAKSMRERFVGAIARLLQSIPVERSNDLTANGTGTVWLSAEDGTTLLGRGTRFTEELHAKDTVHWCGVAAQIGSIDSDEKCTLLDAVRPPSGEWSPYKVTPHVDQSAMFVEVYTALEAGTAVGIFPEGGSHDRPSLLPLKAGIGIMALGAITRHRGLPLQLVPVGLNYFSGHRFRSRVFIDIGEPFTVPEEIAELYASGGEHKHEATARLMQRVEAALGTVTISAADYETLEFFWTLRRLTSNDQREHDAGSKLMSLERQVAFVRRFGRGYDRLLADGTPFKESPRVQHVRSLCRDYNKQLKAMGMRDYQVAFVLDELSRPRAVALLASRVLLLLLYAVCLVPAVLFLPLLVCTRSVAACKAAQAVRGSSVKLEGRDVLSTWKIMVSLVAYPTLYIVYTAAAFSLGGRYLPEPWPLEAGLLFFFLFPVVSYGAVKGGENVVRVARSLVPLGTVVLRPSYGHVLVEQRAALTAAMLGLVDEQGWVMPETPPHTPPHTPPAASADADRLVEPPTLALAASAASPSTRKLSLSDQRILEEMHGEAASAAKVKMGSHSPRRTPRATGLQL